MTIFLYGSDAYRLKKASHETIERYKSKYKSGFNLFYFDFLDTGDTGRLEDSLKSSSFFDEHKLLVCKNVFQKKTTSEEVLKYIKDYGLVKDRGLTLLVVDNLPERDLSKNKDLFKLLSSESEIVKLFEPLAGTKLTEWVQEELRLSHCSIELVALKKLVEVVGSDSWALINEINKLVSYKREGQISLADVNLLVYPKIDLNIFDLIDSIGSRNRLRALELLYKETKNGRDPYYILTMISYQFRNLLIVKDISLDNKSVDNLAKKTGIHPFVFKKTLAQSGKFNPEELKGAYSMILNMELGLKNGFLDPVSALSRFVLSL